MPGISFGVSIRRFQTDPVLAWVSAAQAAGPVLHPGGKPPFRTRGSTRSRASAPPVDHDGHSALGFSRHGSPTGPHTRNIGRHRPSRSCSTVLASLAKATSCNNWARALAQILSIASSISLKVALGCSRRHSFTFNIDSSSSSRCRSLIPSSHITTLPHPFAPPLLPHLPFFFTISPSHFPRKPDAHPSDTVTLGGSNAGLVNITM